jgi:hypothetical protein
MMRVKDMIGWQTHTGASVMVRDIRLDPQSQALVVRWPNGGWVWNRPVAVLVHRGEQAERIPISDVTRITQLGLLGLGAVFGMVTLALSTRGLLASVRNSKLDREAS